MEIQGTVAHLRDRVGLVLYLTKLEEVPLKDMVLTLNWREYEDFCARVLENYGYETVRNLRFRVGVFVREIDVVAWRRNLVLLVECKRWSRRSSREKELRSAVSELRKRAELFTTWLQYTRRLPLSGEVTVVPVLTTVHEGRTLVHEGVPIVPLHSFPYFLTEFEQYLDVLFTLKTYLKTLRDVGLNLS